MKKNVLCILLCCFSFLSVINAQWSELDPFPERTFVQDVVASSGSQVVVGGARDVWVSSNSGVSWIRYADVFPNSIHALIFAEGVYAAVGEDFIATSSDGVTWQTVLTVDNRLTTITHIPDADWNGTFVATGEAGKSTYWSETGTAWNEVAHSDNNKVYSASEGASAAISEKAIVVGNGWVSWTVDRGRTWNRRDYGFSGNKMTDVVAVGSRFFAIGNDGHVEIFSNLTADSLDREEVENVLPDFMNTIIYHNGVFVAGGSSGALQQSTDGRIWTMIQSPATNSVTAMTSVGSSLLGVTGRSPITSNGRVSPPAEPNRVTTTIEAMRHPDLPIEGDGGWNWVVELYNDLGGPLVPTRLGELNAVIYTDDRVVWVYEQEPVGYGSIDEVNDTIDSFRSLEGTYFSSVTATEPSLTIGSPSISVTQGAGSKVCVSWTQVPGASVYSIEGSYSPDFSESNVEGWSIIDTSITSVCFPDASLSSPENPLYVRIRVGYYVDGVLEYSEPSLVVPGWIAQVPENRDAEIFIETPNDFSLASLANYGSASVLLYRSEPDFYIGEEIVGETPLAVAETALSNGTASFTGVPAGDYWYLLRFFSPGINDWYYLKGTLTAVSGENRIEFSGTGKRHLNSDLILDTEQANPAIVTASVTRSIGVTNVDTFSNLVFSIRKKEDGEFIESGLSAGWVSVPRVGEVKSTETPAYHLTFPLDEGEYEVKASLVNPNDPSNSYHWREKVFQVRNNNTGGYRAIRIGIGEWEELRDLNGTVINSNTAPNQGITIRHVLEQRRALLYFAPDLTGVISGSELSYVDIGNPSISGTSSLNDGTYSVIGSGTDLWDGKDTLQYASQTLTGDGYIIAKLDSVESEVAWAKAGILVREGLTDNDRGMGLFQRGTGTRTFLTYRRWAGDFKKVEKTDGTQKWLRIRRRGNVLAASLSFDGHIWFPYGQPVTVNDLAEELHFGLAVTSADLTKTATATFSNVEIKNFSSDLTSVDIDSPALAGSYSYDSGTGVHTVSGSGKILWEEHDQYQYSYTYLEGDGVAQVKIDSIDSDINWATVGIMFRENLARNRRNFGLQVRKDNSRVFRVNRETVNIGPTIRRIFDNSARYLRIERAGDTFTASFSADGTNWTQFGDPVVMPGLSSELLVGLMSSSPDSTKLTTAMFSEFSVTSTGGAASPVPTLSSKKLDGDLIQSRGVKQPTDNPSAQSQSATQNSSVVSPLVIDENSVEADVRYSEDGKYVVLSYERPKNYLDLGLDYRLMVTSSLDDEWIELEMENAIVTPINIEMERVEYTFFRSDSIRHFKVEKMEQLGDWYKKVVSEL